MEIHEIIFSNLKRQSQIDIMLTPRKFCKCLKGVKSHGFFPTLKGIERNGGVINQEVEAPRTVSVSQ